MIIINDLIMTSQQVTRKRVLVKTYSDDVVSEGEFPNIDNSDDDDDYDVTKDFKTISDERRSITRVRKMPKRLGDFGKSPKTSKQTPSHSEANSSDQSNDTDDKHEVLLKSVDEPTSTSRLKKEEKSRDMGDIIPNQDEESFSIEVKQNEFVAFKPLSKYRERPLLAKVVTSTKRSLDVIWFAGSYSTKWLEWTVGKGPDKKIQREKVPRSKVLMGGIKMTSAGKLPVAISKQLRKMYDVIESED
ncbi:uncharacterized protein LOC144742460 [Ciona intestinalis]